ncbi:MAG: hypothetical protein ACJ72N_13210, partial [Labedaea sp.]
AYQAEAVAADGTVTLFRKGSPRPDDPRFHYDEKWDLWETTVQVEECDRLVEIHSFAKYLGVPCQVMALRDAGQALLYYTGGNSAEAERVGFRQTDPGTFSAVAPLSELYDYHEIHTDLQFDRWRELTFAKPAEATSS